MIGLLLILWGVYSLIKNRSKKVDSKKWAETILTKIEREIQLQNNSNFF